MAKERTEHFSKQELSCPCCGVMGMNRKFLKRLEAIREDYGKPMQLNSSFRCAEHNAAINSYYYISSDNPFIIDLLGKN